MCEIEMTSSRKNFYLSIYVLGHLLLCTCIYVDSIFMFILPMHDLVLLQ